MREDAKEKGMDLKIFSDFRGYRHQSGVYNVFVERHGVEKADTFSARPGHSEHQTGLTFDIADGEPDASDNFGDTKAGRYLENNGYKHGFIVRYPKGKEDITGYKYEPWHLRYLGKDLAKKVKDSGLTLDEYLNTAHPDY